jgi:hypothetical protein
MDIVNTALVEQITALIQKWNTADRRLRAHLHGWEQQTARAGLERGFYVQVGWLPEAAEVAEWVGETDDYESIGRVVYEAYMLGAAAGNKRLIQ